MLQGRPNAAMAAQHRVAQKYRVLGYKVEENPNAEHLPEFMRGLRACCTIAIRNIGMACFGALRC